MARLLVVEDDELIGRALRANLEAHGHEVKWRRTGRDAVTLASEDCYDLVLLDLGLPDLDGVEVCRQIRESQPGAVVVMLTARDEEIDVIVGLEAGADDYLTKPIRLAELQARLRAHLRRPGPMAAATSVCTVGHLVVDGERRRAAVAGHELTLRAREFDLLARLAAEPGVVIKRETLMEDVWDEHWFGPTRTLDVHIAQLRRKFGLVDASAEAVPVISTVRGRGYRLEEPDSPNSRRVGGGA